jgi:predicted small lipoprotein YifL
MRARQSCGKKGPTATPKAEVPGVDEETRKHREDRAPPAAMTPTKVNSAAPPRANIASSRVCHQAKPETAEIAPYDSATAMIVMVTMATAR